MCPGTVCPVKRGTVNVMPTLSIECKGSIKEYRSKREVMKREKQRDDIGQAPFGRDWAPKHITPVVCKFEN